MTKTLAFSTLRLAGAATLALAAIGAEAALAGPEAPLAALASAPAARVVAAPESAERAPAVTESVVVMVDHLRRVGFDAPIKTVLIGNPAIADVKMISKYEGVIVAKTVGATNIYFLDQDGRALGDYDVVVREGEARRVVLRRGPSRTELFQCAPRCERTLTQMDSAAAHGALSEVVTKENALAKEAAAAGDSSE